MPRTRIRAPLARLPQTLIVLALLGATAAAFAVTERLKLERSPITGTRVDKVFSPVCECARDVAVVSFILRRPETVTVDILDSHGDPIRTLVRATRSDKYKQFLKGLAQIEEEGAIQLFYPVSSGRREPILAAVGALQFDVVRFRLESEYTVETTLEPLSFSAVRWVAGDPQEIATVANSRGRLRAEDRDGNPVILFSTSWDLRYAEENSAGVRFRSTPFSS